MTRRAILIGLLAAVLMGAGGQYVNKYVPGGQGLVRGQMPVSVFGLFILWVLVLNPAIGRLRRSWRLRAGEIALIAAMVLAACSITDAGLMRHFPRTLIQPVQQNRTHPGWQRAGILEKTPAGLLVNDGQYSPEVVDNYVTAMGRPGQPIAITQVPWHAWYKPLLIWGSLIILVLAAAVSLSVLVHPQWANRERIRYPIAEAASALIKEDETGRPAILRQRKFWLAMGIVVGIRAINGLHVWFPGSIDIPLFLDFSAIGERFPGILEIPGGSAFTAVTLFPACIGLTYLLASDIGFSLGISSLVNLALLGLLIKTGVDISGSPMTGGVMQWQNFGAFVAMAAILIYTGRRYYGLTFREALLRQPQQETQPSGVWAARVLILCVAGSTAILGVAGLPWVLALCAVLGMLMMFLVLARMNAEAGTFFFAPGWQMPGILAGCFGMSVLGPQAIIILGLLMYVLSIDPFECLMPYVSNGLKLASQTSLDVGRTGLLIMLALFLVLAVAIPTALWADYNMAAEMRRGSDTTEIFDTALETTTRLTLAGNLADVENYSSMERLLHMRPEPGFLWAAGLGFALLLGCSLLRLRYTWWPIHPVLFLAIGAYSSLGRFCPSFFLGWLLKSTVLRFGGPATYLDWKPIMLGIIVGDLTGGFMILLSSWIYYLATGIAGPASTFVLW